MVKVRMVIFVVFLVFLVRISFSQIISEVLFSFPYESDFCQYIEIYNNSDQTIDLRYFKLLVQGYEIGITNIFLADFETEGITNSFLLAPHHVAVVLPYSYAYSSKPFYFPSNTLILTASTKYLAKTTPLRYDILSTIKLVSNNEIVDYVSSGQFQNQGISLSRYNNNFVITDKPSFGFVESSGHIWFSKYIYSPKDVIEIFLRLETNANNMQLELVGRGSINLSKVSENLFKGSISFQTNGERIISKFLNMTTSVRVVDLFELSKNLNEKVLLNEICFSPTKKWYNFFLNNSIIGSPSEGDKYIEIVNLNSQEVPVTNMYIHAISSGGEIIINVKENVFYSSLRGVVSNIDYVKPYEYLLVSAPGITSNMCLILKDNHPYKGGRIVHFAEEKNLKIIPFYHTNTFISYGKPTVSILPNALPNSLGGKFLSWYETPSRYNGFQKPTILIDGKFKIIGSKISIYLVSESYEDIVMVRVITKNSRIVRNIYLTNMGLWYFGEFILSNDPYSTIYVEPNDEVTIEYNLGNQRFSETFFVVPQGSMQISKNNEVVIEKSLLKSGEAIRFINTRKGDIIRFFTKDGNFLKEMEVDKDDIYEVNSLFLPRGVYVLVYQRDSIKSIFKVVILD